MYAFFMIFISSSLFFSPLFATDYDEKGMKVYKKMCSSCHGSAEFGASQLEEAEWEDLFMFNAAKLINAHKKEQKVIENLTKKSHKKKLKYLKSFLIGSAKDSGSVGGCDGNRCGIQKGRVLMKKSR